MAIALHLAEVRRATSSVLQADPVEETVVEATPVKSRRGDFTPSIEGKPTLFLKKLEFVGNHERAVVASALLRWRLETLKVLLPMNEHFILSVPEGRKKRKKRTILIVDDSGSLDNNMFRDSVRDSKGNVIKNDLPFKICATLSAQVDEVYTFGGTVEKVNKDSLNAADFEPKFNDTNFTNVCLLIKRLVEEHSNCDFEFIIFTDGQDERFVALCAKNAKFWEDFRQALEISFAIFFLVFEYANKQDVFPVTLTQLAKTVGTDGATTVHWLNISKIATYAGFYDAAQLDRVLGNLSGHLKGAHFKVAIPGTMGDGAYRLLIPGTKSDFMVGPAATQSQVSACVQEMIRQFLMSGEYFDFSPFSGLVDVATATEHIERDTGR